MNFILLREQELAFPKLEVSIFNREQNIEYKLGMLERENESKKHKEKEVEVNTDFLAPYLIKFGKVEKLSFNESLEVRNQCIQDFKQMLLNRANELYRKFEKASEALQNKQEWFKKAQATLSPEQETAHVEEVQEMNFYLNTLELRLGRQRELSAYRYEILFNSLENHPRLEALNFKMKM